MKKIIPLILSLLNIVILSYLPVWRFSHSNLLLPILFSLGVFLYLIVALIFNLSHKKRQDALFNFMLLLINFIGPVVLFLIVFAFQQ